MESRQKVELTVKLNGVDEATEKAGRLYGGERNA